MFLLRNVSKAVIWHLNQKNDHVFNYFISFFVKVHLKVQELIWGSGGNSHCVVV